MVQNSDWTIGQGKQADNGFEFNNCELKESLVKERTESRFSNPYTCLSAKRRCRTYKWITSPASKNTTNKQGFTEDSKVRSCGMCRDPTKHGKCFKLHRYHSI